MLQKKRAITSQCFNQLGSRQSHSSPPRSEKQRAFLPHLQPQVQRQKQQGAKGQQLHPQVKSRTPAKVVFFLFMTQGSCVGSPRIHTVLYSSWGLNILTFLQPSLSISEHFKALVLKRLKSSLLQAYTGSAKKIGTWSSLHGKHVMKCSIFWCHLTRYLKKGRVIFLDSSPLLQQKTYATHTRVSKDAKIQVIEGKKHKGKKNH